jgi:peptide/nickel transport system substrate-binding protein
MARWWSLTPLHPDEVIGALATRWETSPDGLTYTFTLREQVTWWDGQPLTADYVALSLTCMNSPPA